MPLLMCPNDNAAMQTLDRNGVQFDMCPTCRGVWLDRGELEKLMTSATDEGRASASLQAAPQPTYQQPLQQAPQQPWGNSAPQGYGQRPRYDEDHSRKKKKRMDIFDIFD